MDKARAFCKATLFTITPALRCFILLGNKINFLLGNKINSTH
jgi:hypothetical protein